MTFTYINKSSLKKLVLCPKGVTNLRKSIFCNTPDQIRHATLQLVGFVRFFTRKRDALYMILVIGSVLLEFFQEILAFIVLGGRQ